MCAEAGLHAASCLKLEIFIPEEFLETLRKKLREVDAGHIGKYDSCLSWSPVMSTWRPLEGARPWNGTAGETSVEAELKVEVTIRREQLRQVMDAVREAHPYEEPVVNVIPLHATMQDFCPPGT